MLSASYLLYKSMKLYNYVHCPFCVRVRMAAGFLGLSYESQVLRYDDEATPIKLMGKKMLPILEFNGKFLNESLEMIKLIDKNDKLGLKKNENSNQFNELIQYLDELGSSVHSLAMPYWIYTPEFDEKSRKYFQDKKEIKRGPFKQLVRNQSNFIKQLEKSLSKLDGILTPFYRSPVLTIYDILIASHLWGMYVVVGFQFSEKIHQYLQTIATECKFNYHEDFWR